MLLRLGLRLQCCELFTVSCNNRTVDVSPEYIYIYMCYDPAYFINCSLMCGKGDVTSGVTENDGVVSGLKLDALTF
jgi:hypothetical protein